MDLQKATDVVASIPLMDKDQPWNLDLSIDDVMADLDPGSLVWREGERDERL